MTEPRPERVRVTGPPRAQRRTRPRAREIDEETALGSVLMGSLLRAQFRLALLTLVPLAGLAFGLPLAFHLAPELAEVRVAGMPLAWLVLGLLVYPGLVLLGWVHVRRAERHEGEFADLLLEAAEREEP